MFQIEFQEFYSFFKAHATEHSLSAAVDMLEWLEKLYPRLKRSEDYNKLSLRSAAEEASHGSVEAAPWPTSPRRRRR